MDRKENPIDDPSVVRELRRGYHDRIADVREHSLEVVQAAVAGASVAADILGGRPASDRAMDAEQMQARAAAVDAEVVDLLARESPVARDLRVILASRDVTQLALLCVGLDAGLADRIERAGEALGPELRQVLASIADGTVRMLGRAEAAWATLDLDLSSEIVAGATAARVQQTEFMAALIGLGRVPMDAAVAVAMAARAFERLADHAVEIAERVHFAVDGTPAPLLRP